MISTTSPKKFGKKKKKTRRRWFPRPIEWEMANLSKSLVTLEMKWFSF
jgi:hypothetical protein